MIDTICRYDVPAIDLRRQRSHLISPSYDLTRSEPIEKLASDIAMSYLIGFVVCVCFRSG